MNSSIQDTTPIISAQQLVLGYRQQVLVQNINVTIYPSEFIGIFGPNGAGKSTFLRALLGLIQPLSGQIQVLGATPYQGHHKIGYMPQMRSHVAIAHLTSRSLLEATFHGTGYGLPLLSKTKRQQVQNVLEQVEADSFADRPFQQLSGGERQRIFLAQALLGHPSILLLDEPLASLDPHAQEMFIAILQQIQQSLKVTVLFSAHDPNPLLDVMTRVLYFAKKNAVIGPTDEIITSNVLSTLYGMPIEVVRFKERLFVLGEGRHIHEQERSHHG